MSKPTTKKTAKKVAKKAAKKAAKTATKKPKGKRLPSKPGSKVTPAVAVPKESVSDVIVDAVPDVKPVDAEPVVEVTPDTPTPTPKKDSLADVVDAWLEEWGVNCSESSKEAIVAAHTKSNIVAIYKDHLGKHRVAITELSTPDRDSVKSVAAQLHPVVFLHEHVNTK